MTLTLILAVLALSVPFGIRWARARSRPARIDQLRAVDIEAFRNLMDPNEEEYLRQRLPPTDFRKIQRERLQAAVEYVRCAAFNAGVLMQFGEMARRSSDPNAAQAAAKLIDNAIRLRTFSLQTIPKLYLA